MLFRFLVFILLPWALLAQTFELKDSMQGISGTEYMEVFEDTTSKLTIDQVKTKPFKIQN